jgi:hypothetical protein
MDLNTEVEIYRNIFGRHIDENFLPRVLHNFARVVISTRLNLRSDALLEWIKDPKKYGLFCDENMQLLKMEIYTGNIPKWIEEEDRRRLTATMRSKIIAESETEGQQGISGRDSIRLFDEFYSAYRNESRLITMSDLQSFFTKTRKDLMDMIPGYFLESLLRMYNYIILQEVEESLFCYNEERISREIQNYIFAINFEPGSVEKCKFTGEKLEITDDFFKSIEIRLLGKKADRTKRLSFRKDTQKEYTSKTLTQDIIVGRRPITATKLYNSLYERYAHNIKEKVLNPFLENVNFRNAIKDYDKKAFKAYDKRIRDDITFLMNNLSRKYHYTELGAKEVCMYVIDNEIAPKLAN